MPIKIITSICFLFLSYVVLLTLLTLTNRVDKLTNDLHKSNEQIQNLKQELTTSQVLIGNVDAELELPRE